MLKRCCMLVYARERERERDREREREQMAIYRVYKRVGKYVIENYAYV